MVEQVVGGDVGNYFYLFFHLSVKTKFDIFTRP